MTIRILVPLLCVVGLAVLIVVAVVAIGLYQNRPRL